MLTSVYFQQQKTAWKKLVIGIVLFVTIFSPVFPAVSGGFSTASIAHAQTDVKDETLAEANLPSCINFTDFNLLGCAGQGVYWLLWWPTQWFAARAAQLMDYFIFYSIQDTTYRSGRFVEEGWKVVRDLSNLVFIFALLYIAISFILDGVFRGNPKKLLVWVIIMGLLINFSLFFTRVVVDVGNIFARILYTNMNLVASSQSPTPGRILEDYQGVKTVSLMIVDIADPQKMIQTQVSLQPGGIAQGDINEDYAIHFIIISIAATLFNIFLIYLFVSVTTLFLGRTVGIYFLMIFAPLAFASTAFKGYR